MKKLYLLRHAEASSDFSSDDKDRSLTSHGVAQARLLAHHFIDIDITLCSSAKRTQMTAEAVKESDGNLGTIEYQDFLYNAPAGDLLGALQERSENNVLIIAHNPGIHMLARSIADKGDQEQRDKLSLFYPPASLSIFDCDIESWKQLEPYSQKLLDFITQD
ncbi:MAG: histidine phosphatase family protein [Pseudomonadota bacterium]